MALIPWNGDWPIAWCVYRPCHFNFKLMSEKVIETQIIAFIRYNGGWVQKVQSGMMKKAYAYRTGDRQGMERSHWIHLADQGTPDLLACISGKFVAIEVKKDAKEMEKWEKSAETDKRSAAQHVQQEKIREAGGITLVVCSVEEVEADLRELKLLP